MDRVGYTAIVPAQGTATITVSNYATIAGDATVTINGKALTNGVEWSNATGNDETATSIAAAITTATADTACYATATGAVVTIKSNAVGPTGNGLTIATSDAAKLLKSAAVTSGGSSGTIGTSGTAQMIYGVNAVAGGNTCNIDIYDGTSASDTLVLRLSCTASVSNIFKFPYGIKLASGCFANITVTATNAIPSSVVVFYQNI